MAEDRLQRLRFEPIWQALDEQNYRKAVMLCDRKEVSQMPLAKVRRWHKSPTLVTFLLATANKWIAAALYSA